MGKWYYFVSLEDVSVLPSEFETWGLVANGACSSACQR